MTSSDPPQKESPPGERGALEGHIASSTGADSSAQQADASPNGWAQQWWVQAAFVVLFLPIGFLAGPAADPSLLRWPYLAILATVAFTDVRERRIPNVVTYPSILFALGAAIGTGFWPSALAGALAYGIVMIVPVVIYGPERAGIGDVKLALFIGLVLGLSQTLYLAVLVGAGAAAIVGVVGIIFGKLHRHSTIPFGAFMALGAAVALLQAA